MVFLLILSCCPGSFPSWPKDQFHVHVSFDYLALNAISRQFLQNLFLLCLQLSHPPGHCYRQVRPISRNSYTYDVAVIGIKGKSQLLESRSPAKTDLSVILISWKKRFFTDSFYVLNIEEVPNPFFSYHYACTGSVILCYQLQVHVPPCLRRDRGNGPLTEGEEFVIRAFGNVGFFKFWIAMESPRFRLRAHIYLREAFTLHLVECPSRLANLAAGAVAKKLSGYKFRECCLSRTIS